MESYVGDRVIVADYLRLICFQPLYIVADRLLWILLDVEEMIRLLLDGTNPVARLTKQWQISCTLKRCWLCRGSSHYGSASSAFPGLSPLNRVKFRVFNLLGGSVCSISSVKGDLPLCTMSLRNVLVRGLDALDST